MAQANVWQERPAAAPILDAYERLEEALRAAGEPRGLDTDTPLRVAYELTRRFGLPLDMYEAMQHLRQVREVVEGSPTLVPSPKAIRNYLQTVNKLVDVLAKLDSEAA